MCDMQELQMKAMKGDKDAEKKMEEKEKEAEEFGKKLEEKYKDQENDEAMEAKARKIFEEEKKRCEDRLKD